MKISTGAKLRGVKHYESKVIKHYSEGGAVSNSRGSVADAREEEEEVQARRDSSEFKGVREPSEFKGVREPDRPIQKYIDAPTRR